MRYKPLAENRTPRHELISKAIDFTSFLLMEKDIMDATKAVILFGSVVRDQHDAESDIDIFLDIYKNGKTEKLARDRLDLWERGREIKYWELRGVKNPIQLHVGKLDEWESLKRVIVSGGIALYGKYTIQHPKDLKHNILITVELSGRSMKNIMSIRRQLLGYKQKIGKKIYTSSGLLGELSGKRIGRNVFIVPVESAQKLYVFFRSYRINYTVLEVWTE